MYTACKECGSQFWASRRGHVRCSACTPKGRNKTREMERKRHDVEFIGVDGEGVYREDGTHDYVMMSVGDSTLTNGGRALGWYEIFDFLYEHFKENPTATYVGFFLGYDFTQWLKTLPEDRAKYLYDKKLVAMRNRVRSGGNHVPFPVRCGDWEFDLHADKRFKLRRKDDRSWMYICDAGSFFQTSLMKAIDPHTWTEPIVSDDEYAVLEEGKARRATAQLDSDMVRYNVLENEVLGRLMGTLNKGFVSAGVRLSRQQWYGPGQAAQAWLDGIKAPLGDDVREVMPKPVRDMAQKSYYGGWFEIFYHGHVQGTVYEYDINSAYPYEISILPCLLHGTWVREQRARYCLVHATVKGSDRWCGPIPFRDPSGAILRPSEGRGWYWWHELHAANRAGLVDSIEVHDAWSYLPCDCPPPIAEIAKLYNKRLEVGKNTPMGKALKLMYNSSYGKFAQSVGHPKYANGVYASLITAGCRTRILQAIATHPLKTEGLVMVATDGVYFDSPHPKLELSGEKLGAWDEAKKENLTLLMPGVYWDDKTRAAIASGKSPSLKSRGISARDLAQCIDSFDEQFRVWRPGMEWPSMQIPINFSMVSARLAMARHKWETAGYVNNNAIKVLSSDPTSKRMDAIMPRNWGTGWRTFPYPHSLYCDETMPYTRTFGEMQEDDITDDGNVFDVLRWALQV